MDNSQTRTIARTNDRVTAFRDEDRASLCEALDRVLDTGAVVAGEVMLSVADVDLVYLGLQLVLTSIERGRDKGCALRLACGEVGEAPLATHHVREAHDARL